MFSFGLFGYLFISFNYDKELVEKIKTLSPVFNIRGKANISESENYAEFSYYLSSGDRNYISY